MRRICIDDNIKRIVEEYARALTDSKSNLINWKDGYFPKEKLQNFESFLNSYTAKDYKPYARYVKEIRKNIKKILKLFPDEFDDYHKSHFATFDEEKIYLDLNEKIDYGGKHFSFHEHVVRCMRFDDGAYKNMMRKYIYQMRIKACIYCNAQYAVTTEECEIDGEKKRIGTYQLDHFYDKARYPYLCISFFNLHPCCSTCNQSKGTRRSLFNLYCNNQDDVDVFEFRLTPEKALDAWVSDNMKDLSVELDSENKELLENHNLLFHIDLIYQQHLDVVVRIIRLLHWYDHASQEALNDSFNGLFPNGVEDPEYFFFGYYMKKDEVHYQPLSKLVQDVVSQLRS